ncbi:MAG: hypothetical protein JWP06_343 [Candidatus Saccharibacteria bacterium]|nr:hypothetical protein [Candidatus Saccharibacteria bacterium]
MKKFYLVLVGLIVAAGSIFLFNFLGGVSKAALPEDCDSNSVIYCGGTTAATLAARYKANKTGDLDNIYSAYGLSANDMTHAGTIAKMGEVRKDGRVMVGGKTVATDAHSIGRHSISGSTKKVINGKTYYQRTPSISFAVNSIAAYVFFDANGNFRAAVLTSCGNPVSAKPPVYKCDSLTSKAITRTQYGFTAAASASNGASVTSYTYDFGDGKKTTTAAKTINHDYVTPGTYTAKLSVTMNVNGTAKTVTAPSCQTTIKVSPPPVTPTYVCDSLTATKISRTEYAFNGKATVTGGATITNYVFDFGDTKTQTVTNPTNVTHTYDKAGTYTAKLSVNVKVNGVNKTVTSTKCQVPVTVEEIPVTPVYTCDSLTATKISRTDFTFTGKATANGGATITNYVFDFGDSKTQTVTNPTAVAHTYDKVGTYTAKLTVNFKVNGVDKTATGTNCQVPVTVEEIPVTPVYTCDSLSVTKISKTEASFTGKATATGGATITNYVFDFGDSKTETVTNPSDVKHTYAEAKDYTAKLTVNFMVNNEAKTVTGPNCTVKVTVAPEECKPGIPVGDVRCTEECKPGIPVGDSRCTEECKPGIPTGDERCTPCDIPGKEQYPKNDTVNCVETPVELPHTGATENLLTLLGAGSLIAAAGYYIASRRALP